MPNPKPRYRSSAIVECITRAFVGHAGELDVWVEADTRNIVVIGPRHRIINEAGYNYDVYRMNNGSLRPLFSFNQLPLDGSSMPDVHMELHELCILHQLYNEFGLGADDLGEQNA